VSERRHDGRGAAKDCQASAELLGCAAQPQHLEVALWTAKMWVSVETTLPTP